MSAVDVAAARAALTGASVDLNAAAMPTKCEVFVASGRVAAHLRDAIETILLDHSALSERIAAAPAFLAEVERIAGDYCPDSDREATMALAEMREALQAAIALLAPSITKAA